MTASAETTPIREAAPRKRRRLGLFGLQVLLEITSARRSAEYVVGLVLVPALLYAMFALPNDSTWIEGGAAFATIAIASFASYGVISLAIFTFVDDLAKERGRGWIRTMRATPLPIGNHLVAKLCMAAVYSLLIVGVLAAVSVPTGGSSLDLGSWLTIAALGVVGVIAFGMIGISIAFLVRPKAATAIANLVFLPLAFASGFFFPLSEIPSLVRDIAPWLPSYHFGRLMWSTVASQPEIDLLTGIGGQSIWMHGAWVVGLAVIGFVAARLVIRRDAVTAR